MNPSKTSSGGRIRQSAAGFLGRFSGCSKGIAAVEFALVAPMMIGMYFAVTEFSDAYMASSKVTSVASTAADLAAQESAICNAEMTDIFAAISAIIFPYPENSMRVIISSVIDTGNGNMKVAWSDAQNTSARAVNSTVTVPAGLVDPGGSVIFAEVSYDYSSPAGHLIYGTRTFSDQYYLHPRRAAQVARSAGNC